MYNMTSAWSGRVYSDWPSQLLGEGQVHRRGGPDRDDVAHADTTLPPWYQYDGSNVWELRFVWQSVSCLAPKRSQPADAA